MGKGSDYRPCDKRKFDSNFDEIFGKKDISEFHRDKTRGLKVSWPSIEKKEKNSRTIVCTICGHEFVQNKTEPCSHVKNILENI